MTKLDTIKDSIDRTAAAKQLHIAIFGGCHFWTGENCKIDLPSRKGRALVTYLAVNRIGSASRETLANLLWGDRSDGQARASLRQCLRQIRMSFEAAGFDGLTASREVVVLNTTRVSVDLVDQSHRISASEVEHDLFDQRFHPEKILAGYEDLDDSFDAWIRVQRHQWEDRLIPKAQLIDLYPFSICD